MRSAHGRLDLPERFDYGNTVPLAVAVDSPMTEANHVRRVDVLAEGDPFPEVATFHFPRTAAARAYRPGFNSTRASRKWSRSQS